MKEKTKFWIIISLIFIIVTSVFYICYSKNNKDKRNMKNSVSITNPDLLKHELITNEGFKVVITGEAEAKQPITNIEYFKESSKFLYLEKNIERYTMHTRTTTDNKGHTYTETYYSWDTYDSDKQQIKDIKILNHMFNDTPLAFYNIKSIQLDKIINNKYKNKISGNYVYLDNKYIHMVGDKRIYFKGVYNNSLISLAGEISNKTISPYNKYEKVLVFDNNKEIAIKQLKSKSHLSIVIYLIALSVLVSGGIYFYKDIY